MRGNEKRHSVDGVERDRIARIPLVVDGVEPDHLARQVESEYVLAAVAVDDVGLDRAGAHRGDGIERVALAEHVVAGMERTDVLDQHVQLHELALVHALREAGLRERAGRAELQTSPSSATVRASASGKTGRLMAAADARLDRARELDRRGLPQRSR